jgi:hypothetical protein
MYDEPIPGSYNLGCFYPREPVKHDDIDVDPGISLSYVYVIMFHRLSGIKTT